MLTNLTIDDVSQDIIYSPNWAPQLSSDPNSDMFFQSTYHSAQADGASANITFSGSSIYLFGTKGPSHANYSVQFDNFIIFLSANAPETMYQQPLFAYTFATSGTHFISLTSHFVPDGKWLDLDYMTITVNDTETGPSSPSGATVPSASQTISPPWLTLSSTAATASVPALTTSIGASNASPTSANNISGSSNSSTVTLILAIAFGSFIAACTLIALLLYFCRRRLRPSPAPEHPNMFQYKIAPDHSPLSSPALVVPDIYTTQATINSRSEHTIDSERGLSPQGLRVETPGPRPVSPHSGVSGGGATLTTQQSQGQSQMSTIELLSAHRNAPPVYTHDRANVHTRNGSQAAISPLSKQTFDTQDTLVTVGNPSRNVNRFGKVFDFLSKPPEIQHRHRPSIAQRSPPRLPMPEGALPALPPAPPRPQRPQDDLLDWLGNNMDVVAQRSQTATKKRTDDSSEWTNFLKV